MASNYFTFEDLYGIDSGNNDLYQQLMAAFGETDPAHYDPAASGEIDLAHYDPQDTSISAIDMPASSTRDAVVYNNAKTSRPLNLLSLPCDVLHKIYAMVLGPPTTVKIRNTYDRPIVEDSISSPINLFLVSREVHREAASVFYGRTKFQVQHDWGVSFMTGHMGIDNCRHIHHLTVYMQFAMNMQLTIHSVFPNLMNLVIVPQHAWYFGVWYDFQQGKHGGITAAALAEAVVTSAERASFGLEEYMRMSRHYAVTMFLPHWGKGGDNGRHPDWMLLTLENPKWTFCKL